ncbi:MAG: site-2 protease family protein [Acidibrevibacterium sp.]|jgi:Zn-dependent protease|uniref:site-2 protease family protein n=1 Tax=Acidibrevibacterium fodinaquatile TaxID=1969806 RepID=UPI000E0DC69B|nr:site-2 protease family protein [Acidibrevibacterium fodinaquatile]MCA7119912.1 site-2 protease family protein [Acidibrevibacterium fodinaquatile]
MIGLALQLALAVVPVVLAITLHEAAHGYAALAMGDDTARAAGRLSLNPLRHIDRVGTVLLPGILLIGQWLTLGRVVFLFGWAKPVPVAAWKFRSPRRGMMVVAAAGPAMNFLLAWLAALALHALAYAPPRGAEIGGVFIYYFVLTNLVLGIFNLLPIPPLDGGRIVVGLLPLRLARRWALLERVGILLVLLVVFILPQVLAGLGWRVDPVGAALDHIVPRAIGVVLWLAGVSGHG